MPDITEAIRPTVQTEADRARSDALLAEHRASLDDAIGAVVHDSYPAVLVRLWQKSGYEPDPAWKLDQAKLNELADGLDPDLREGFGSVFSEEQARLVQINAQAMQDRRRALASMGWSGTALKLGASVLDPAALSAGLATGGLGTAAAFGGRAARVGNLIQAGLVASVPFAGLEAARAADDPSVGSLDVLAAAASGFGFGAAARATAAAGRPVRFLAAGAGQALPAAAIDSIRAMVGDERTADDVLFAATASFLMGGIAHSIHSGPDAMDAGARRAARRVEFNDFLAFARRTGAKLTGKGEAYFRDQLQPERPSSAWDTDAAENMAIDPAAGERGSKSARAADLPEVGHDRLSPLAKPLPKLQLKSILEDGGIPKYVLNPIAEQGHAGKSARAPVAETLEQVARGEIAEEVSGATRMAALAESLNRRGELSGIDLAELDAGQLRPGDAWRLDRRWRIEVDRVEADPFEGGEFVVVRAFEEGGGIPVGGTENIEPDPIEFVVGRGDKLPANAGSLVRGEAPSIAAAVAKDFEAKVGVPQAAMGAAAGSELAGPPPRGEVKFGDLDLSRVSDVHSAMARLGRIPTRFDMPGDVGQSDIPSFRLIANAIGPDPLLKADGTSVYTAREWVVDRDNGFTARVHTGFDALYGDYVRSTRDAGGKALSREDFMDEVGRAWRRPRGEYSNDPFINKAADLARSWTAEVHGVGVRHKVKGFDKFEADERYVTRLADRNKIDAAITRFGEQHVRTVLAEAIAAGSDGMSPEVANKVARAWLKNAGKLSDGTDVGRSRLFAADQSEELAKVLREAVPSITDAEVEDVLYAVKPRGESNLMDRAKRRISMDETYGRDVIDDAGGLHEKNLGTLRVEDLLENNAENILRLYSRQVHGAAAMAEVYRIARRGPDDVVESIDALLSRLARDARDLGHATPRGELKPAAASDLAKIEVMLKLVAGIPLSEQTALVRAARVVRNLNFWRVMSNVGSGIQNAGEILESIVENGAAATWKQIPAMFEVFKRASTGNLSNEVLRELELIGIGAERINRRIQSRIGDDEGVAVGLNRAELLSARAARLAGDVSLVAPVQSAIARINGLLIKQKWMDLAMSGKSMTPRRLAATGVDANMAERIAGQLRQFATRQQGLTGVRLLAANEERWADIEAASHFRAAVSKTARRLVLTNDPAASALWMTKESGKIISQLRTFAFGSWTNKLLHEVQMRDRITFTKLGVLTVGAAATYVARTYLESIGKPDRERYLRERLTPGAIAKAGFSRASWSSLIPTAVDTLVSDIGGRPQVFGYARTTGLTGGALFGNPSVDWARAAARTIGAVQAPFADDYDFSREDVRNIRDGLWIPNLLGVRNIIDQLTRKLPARSLKRAG